MGRGATLIKYEERGRSPIYECSVGLYPVVL